MAAPVGNKNAAKGKEWEYAIRRALHKSKGALERIADKVVEAAGEGDRWAIDHIAERLDGKPKQTIDTSLTVRDERSLSDAQLAAIAAGDSSSGIAEASGHPGESESLVH